MSNWKLSVKGYGKIEKAELEIAPLTFFVGDNNSGKSYLMSLLWGIHSMGRKYLFNSDGVEIQKCSIVLCLKKEIETVINQKVQRKLDLSDKLPQINQYINKVVKNNKDSFVNNIFNTTHLLIDELSIEILKLETREVIISLQRNNKMCEVRVGDNRFSFPVEVWTQNHLKLYIIGEMLTWIILNLLGINAASEELSSSTVYMPATRTGFMLTKDVINKFGRRNTYDLSYSNQNISEDVQPFIKPIIQFLDILNDLSDSTTGSDNIRSISDFIEKDMTNGRIQINNLPNKSITYLPKDKDVELPLRLTSAVVTELSPLVLMLKHKQHIDKIFYEEPEMCLHPQLQKNMGRVLCKLVNENINIIATTHSDILLQHVNNMIKLSHSNNRQELLSRFKYEENDLIDQNRIAMYQLEDRGQGNTSVKRLECNEYGFEIPTFNDALDRILDEISALQDDD